MNGPVSVMSLLFLTAGRSSNTNSSLTPGMKGRQEARISRVTCNKLFCSENFLIFSIISSSQPCLSGSDFNHSRNLILHKNSHLQIIIASGNKKIRK